MTQPTADLSETLSSIESIKSHLAGLVQVASDQRGGVPVRLTYVGGEFVKAVGSPFEKHVTALADRELLVLPKSRRKLANFVEAYCQDIFELTKDGAGISFVTPSGRHTEEATRTKTRSEPAALRFHRAVWAAFIRPLEGTRRFLNLDSIGFTNAAEMPEEGNWREIEEEFIVGLAPGLPVNGSELQSRIERWAQHAGVEISRLVTGPNPPRERLNHLEQLFEIIEALPPQVAASWAVPALVLKHLRDAR